MKGIPTWDVSCRERNSSSGIEEQISDESTCWTTFDSFSINIMMLCLKIVVGYRRIVLESEGFKSVECEDPNYDDVGKAFDNEKQNFLSIFRTISLPLNKDIKRYRNDDKDEGKKILIHVC